MSIDKISKLIIYVCFILFMWLMICYQVEVNERLDKLENKIELNQNKDK